MLLDSLFWLVCSTNIFRKCLSFIQMDNYPHTASNIIIWPSSSKPKEKKKIITLENISHTLDLSIMLFCPYDNYNYLTKTAKTTSLRWISQRARERWMDNFHAVDEPISLLLILIQSFARKKTTLPLFSTIWGGEGAK